MSALMSLKGAPSELGVSEAEGQALSRSFCRVLRWETPEWKDLREVTVALRQPETQALRPPESDLVSGNDARLLALHTGRKICQIVKCLSLPLAGVAQLVGA